MNTRALRLCLVTNLQNQSFSFYKPLLLKAIRGGITSVQLREKTQNFAEFRQLALQFKATLQPFNIPLIINDHVELAHEINADGVHLGQSDLSPSVARKILGPQKIIGWSVETIKELEIANQLTCLNYIAASAVFPSKTKPNCKTIWGLSGLRKVIGLSTHPVMAIGGINLSNISEIMTSGACGAAVIGAIHNQDPQKSAADLITKIDNVLDCTRLPCFKR